MNGKEKASPMRPLRIGVFVNGKYLRGWEYRILEEIVDDTRFVVAAVIANATQTTRRRWKTLPWRILNNLENTVSRYVFSKAWRGQKIKPDDMLDLTRLVPEANWRRVSPLVSPGGTYHEFQPDDLAALKALDLDVIIRFGFNVLLGDVLRVPRFGIWSYHHADNRINRGGPPAFWEFFNSQSTTSVTLQVLTADLDGGHIICRGRYPTFPYSWNENRRRLIWRSRFLITDALKRLAKLRDLAPISEDDLRPLRLYDYPLYRAPAFRVASLALGKIVVRVLAALIERRFRPSQWRLLIWQGDLEGASLRRFRQLKPPPSKFWADPFHIRHGEEDWLVFEEFDFRSRKAHISCGKVTNGSLQDCQTILASSSHLSYPFVFQHDGHLWMIPESHQAGVVDLYRCDTFPSHWSKVRTLLSNVSAADTTLLQHDSKWWLFTNIERSGLGDHSSELHIYIADDPIHGEWQPHAANPVVRDCLTARMAGAFFIDTRGRLIRCSQRRGHNYGEALQFLSVTALSETLYSEQLQETVQPHWEPDAIGLHHCHFSQEFAVLDVRIRG